MNRYAAKLLFQFRVVVNGDSGKRRLCEERIVLIEAATGRAALRAANRRGKEVQYRYRNSDGNPVSFEFIGVMELLSLGSECLLDEVWYDLVERILPSERKSVLIPPAKELNAIRNEPSKSKRSVRSDSSRPR